MARDTKTKLPLGFAAILGLMIILTSAALMLHADSVKHIETIVHAQNVKTDLIIRMRSAARERTVSLHKMLIMTDPFDRDEEWMRFNEYGAEFAHARQTFLTLEQSEIEKALLAQQAMLVHRIGPLQKSIALQILEGDKETSHSQLLAEAIPLQDQTFAVLSRLFKVQQAAAHSAELAAKADFYKALWIMLLATAVVTLFSGLIARHVIHKTEESEQQLYDEKERAQITLHSIGDAVITTNAEGKIDHINAAAVALMGVKATQAQGRALRELLPIYTESHINTIVDPVVQVYKRGAIISSEDDSIVRHTNGKEYAVEYTAAPIFNRGKKIIGIILVVRDVTEMRSMSRQLSFQAHHDALTGLANRPHFEARLEEMLAEARRYKDQGYWLCYLDLDQFKVVNDTCGHLAGDELLKQVANSLRHFLRDSDLLARIGGDEFSILLKRCDPENAKSTIERLLENLQQIRFSWDDKSFSVTASIGLVPITANSGGPYDVMRAADTACYIAKDAGRNRIHVYERTDDTTVQREGEMQWVHRINGAIESGRFVLYFQPIQKLAEADNALHGEILLRMLDENGDLVPPGAFIPAAERYNLMSSIDRWVIANAFDRFVESCKHESQDYLFSINLSAQSLCEDSLLDFVMEQFERTKLDPHMICFEITETAAIANLSRAVQFIDTLKKLGCSFSLDDFGSGLSSFAYLKTMPVDYLKIDGTFVRDIESDPMDLALVSSINQMGHVMGIKTIAEYVENQAILHMLNDIGVDFGQGYGIQKPVPLDEVLTIPQTSQNRKAV